jgi:hypothetical protein
MIKYKIVEVNEAEHSVVARFYTDKITEMSMADPDSIDPTTGKIGRCRTDYNITVPIPAPTGAAFDEFIQAHAPSTWFGILEAIADPVVDTSMTEIKALVDVEKISSAIDTVVAATAPASDILYKDAVLTAAIQRVLAEMAGGTV